MVILTVLCIINVPVPVNFSDITTMMFFSIISYRVCLNIHLSICKHHIIMQQLTSVQIYRYCIQNINCDQLNKAGYSVHITNCSLGRISGIR